MIRCICGNLSPWGYACISGVIPPGVITQSCHQCDHGVACPNHIHCIMLQSFKSPSNSLVSSTGWASQDALRLPGSIPRALLFRKQTDTSSSVHTFAYHTTLQMGRYSGSVAAAFSSLHMESAGPTQADDHAAIVARACRKLNSLLCPFALLFRYLVRSDVHQSCCLTAGCLPPTCCWSFAASLPAWTEPICPLPASA